MQERTSLREGPLDPRTHRWSTSRKIGMGALSILPGGMLLATIVAALGNAVASAPIGSVAVLAYTHVVSQLIVLGVFGHLVTANRRLDRVGTTAWVAFFLVLAPVAVPLYWYLHVWSASEPRTARVISLDDFGADPA